MGALAATFDACPVCGHVSFRTLFARDGYTFLRCRTCSTRYASPRPGPADLAAVYESGYFDARGWAGDPSSDSAYMTRCYAEVAPILAARYPARGRLLDVGCATGAFIAAAAADGWRVSGLEYSEAAASRARAAGLDVRSGDLASGAFDGETFEVVSAWHVIEHLVDPVADLRRMRALAAPGGVLVAETPNARSIGALVRRARWTQIRVPEHINFFDRAAIERALEASGWRLAWARTIYKRDSAERIAGRRWLAPAARAAARGAEAAGMGGNLRVLAEAA